MRLDLKGITSLIGDLNEEAIHALYGASQVGKTTLMLQCAYNYSHLTGRSVLFYDTEGGGSEFVNLWDKKFRAKYPKAKKVHVRMKRNWMDILADHGKVVKLKTSDNGRMSVNVVEYNDSAVEKFCKDNDIGFVIYDSITMPMKAFGNSQENFPARNYAQSLWLNGMLDVIDRCNCIVFTNHHSSKNPADQYSVEQMSGGSAVQYFSKVILFMKKIDAKGARTYRRIKLSRYFNKPPNQYETLVNLTDDGYIDTTEDAMEKDKAEARKK